MKNVGIHGMILIAAWGVAGCGVRDTPLEPGEADGGAPAMAGSGGASAGATSGGSSFCDGDDDDDDTPHAFHACWGRVSGEEGGTVDDIHAETLRVIDAVEPDLSLCDRGFPPSFRLAEPTAPFAAWIVEGSEGRRWIVQFAVEGANPDVLSPDDVVHLRRAWGDSIDGMVRGAVWIERLGLPAVGFALHEPPAFSGVPDFAITPGPAVCSAQENDACGVWRAVRIEANGESTVVPHHQSADVGGFTVFNARYTDLLCSTVIQEPEFLLGFYSRG